MFASNENEDFVMKAILATTTSMHMIHDRAIFPIETYNPNYQISFDRFIVNSYITSPQKQTLI